MAKEASMKSQWKKFLRKVTDFVDIRRESDRGGWAECTTEDVNQFHNILEALLEMKFEPDADGDMPIDLHVIDRTQFWPSHYFAIPYTMIDKEGESEDEYRERMLRAFDLLLMNLRTATEAVEKFTGPRGYEGVEANIRREAALQRVKPLETKPEEPAPLENKSCGNCKHWTLHVDMLDDDSSGHGACQRIQWRGIGGENKNDVAALQTEIPGSTQLRTCAEFGCFMWEPV